MENHNGLALVHGDGARHQAIASSSVFDSIDAFENAQRMAKALACSDLVPDSYKNNIPNTLIALEISRRIGCSPLMVMQNLNVIQGKPSWSSTFIVAAVNACGRFSPLRFALEGEGDDRGCFAWATDKSGERLEGTRVTIGMAKSEGWTTRKGSKWQTMPDLMLRYRAATFFGRMYAPDILMGMRPADEQEDIRNARQTHQAANDAGRVVDVETGEILVEAEAIRAIDPMELALASATLAGPDDEQ